MEFQPGQVLGEGTFGVVSEVILPGGVSHLWAVKRYKDQNPVYGVQNLLEVDTMRSFEHPHLLHAEKLVYTDPGADGHTLGGNIGFMMPLAAYSLGTLIDRNLYFPWNRRIQVVYQILKAVEFLHQQNRLHLDVKIDNILLYSDLTHPQAVLCDFGGVGLLTGPPGNEVVTSPYPRFSGPTTPPENLFPNEGPAVRRYTYTKAGDVWSLGILLVHVLNLSSVYPNERVISLAEMAQQIPTMFGAYREGTLARLVEHVPAAHRRNFYLLLDGIFRVDPASRWTLSDILASPLFAGLPEVTGSLVPVETSSGAHPDDFRDLLKTIAIISQQLSPVAPARVLFLAMDLLQRIRGHLNGSKAEKYSLTMACWWMAHKFITDDTFRFTADTLATEATRVATVPISASDILQAEKDAVRFLGGIIYRPYLYELARTPDDLILFYQDLLISKENYVQYPYLQLQELRTLWDLPDVPLQPAVSTMTVQELFN